MRYSIGSILLLLAFFFTANTLASGDKQSLTATEIINKHLAAIGGKKALDKLKSRMAIGTVKKENEPVAAIAIASEPNRLSALYRFQDFDWRFIYDGKKADNRPMLPRQLSVVRDKYLEMTASGLMFYDISLYNILSEVGTDNVQFVAKGLKKLNGRSTHVVEARHTNSKPMRLYFDAETFMWVRKDYGTVDLRKPQINSGNLNDVVNNSRVSSPYSGERRYQTI